MLYPGDHGAPDLSGLAPDVLHPKMLSYNELAPTEPNADSYQHSQPGESSFDTMHKQAHPRSSGKILQSDGIYTPDSSGYASYKMLGYPGGQSVGNPGSSFKEVKRVAFPPLAEAPGMSDLVTLDPRGHKPLSLSYNEHDLAVDESAPNVNGMSFSEVPHSMGHAAYQSAQTVNGLLQRRGRGKMPGLVYGNWKMIRYPPPQNLRRGLIVKPFPQGKAILKTLRKPK